MLSQARISAHFRATLYTGWRAVAIGQFLGRAEPDSAAIAIFNAETCQHLGRGRPGA